jgi:DNA polymerase III delta prime subunit
MQNVENHPLWVERYRPRTVSDTILPDDLKNTFQSFIKNKHIPNLILSGTAGVGKTTVARAMLEEIECDYVIINGSLDANKDTLRNEIKDYASTMSFIGGRKYVILDEADYLHPSHIQPALRNFMEEFSKTCGFILTCNYKNKIIEPLHSRCSVIDFKINKQDMPKLASLFFKRVNTILDTEKVEFDKQVVASLITQYYPDSRRILNELQRYSANGKIDSGIFANLKSTSIKDLIILMKAKNFSEVRKWVKNNVDTNVHDMYNQFYDHAAEYFKSNNIPALVLLIAKYQYQNAFSANPEINFVAFLAEAMIDLEFV